MAAKVQFNAAWWKKNSAKTLVNSGMEPALKAWEKASKKKGVGGDALIEALTALKEAAEAAEGKANKVLHKETIGYLQAYQTECARWIKALKEADGRDLADPKNLLTKPVLEMIRTDPRKKGIMYYAELKYLQVTVKDPGTGSKRIHDTFLEAGADLEVNLNSGELQRRCADAAEREAWDDPVWLEARNVVVKTSLKGSNLTGLEKEVLKPLAQDPLIAEIQSL